MNNQSIREVQADELLNTVIKGGYCSGCGICTATKDSPFEMKLTAEGNYLPEPKSYNSLNQQVVCPFADHNINEDTIAKESFEFQNQISKDSDIGYFTSIYAGYVEEGNFRQAGSSGGSVTWVCDELLTRKLVDFVIHVKDNTDPNKLFQYSISDSSSSLRNGAKSRYYPVTLEDVLEKVREIEGTYIVVGVPCFIKGINLLRRADTIYAERIKYTAAIFCGHLKTTHYLESIVDQFGTSVENVQSFDFRHKLPGRDASDYGTKVITKSGEELIKINREVYGTNWGLGLFKLKACDYCDDVIGETADISFGDAWLPKYINDHMGTNVIVIRNTVIETIIQEGIECKKIFYEPLSKEDLYRSQAGGFRHRRNGLTHRLHLQDVKGVWRPTKRVMAKRIEDKKRRLIYENRIDLQQTSFYSKNYKNIDKLRKELKPYVLKNKILNDGPLLKRVVNKLMRIKNTIQSRISKS